MAEYQTSQEVVRPPLPPSRHLMREQLFIARQASVPGMPVVPGEQWGVHYPGGAAARAEQLQAVLDGKASADIVLSLRPNGVVFSAQDIETAGIDGIIARLKDMTTYLNGYDYNRFGHFVESMRGTGMTAADVEHVYNTFVQTRYRQNLLKAYGLTGREQIRQAIIQDAKQIEAQFPSLSRVQKVLELLKLDWSTDTLALVDSQIRDRLLAELSGNDRGLYQEWQAAFQRYVATGDEGEYQSLVSQIQSELPKVQAQEASGEVSDSMQQLQKDLEDVQEKAVNPGSQGDPDIPPEDQDEYVPNLEAFENLPNEESDNRRVFFEITPVGESTEPMIGYYPHGKKSYYNRETLTWSKKKVVQPYDTAIYGEKRQRMKGRVTAGLKALPVPSNYAFDISSLQFEGAEPKILRDQNGCFYIQTEGNCSYSIDFLSEQPPFDNQPIPEDTEPIHSGNLSVGAEQLITRLHGSAIQRAQHIQQYVFAHHFYPGGGDLKVAGALQHKLKTSSTGENYIQNLENSEYLECYSSNTLFIAMLRKAGIPARLVTGDRIQKTQNGKAVIDETTGHAWAEVWDGQSWRRIDATPPVKPEDVKDKKPEESDPATEAEDNGIDQPNQGQSSSKGKSEGEKTNDQQPSDQSESTSEGTPPQEPTEGKGKPSATGSQDGAETQEMSDEDFARAEQQFNQMQQDMQRMEERKSAIQQQMNQTASNNAASFDDIHKLEEQLKQEDLLDDMKKNLQDKLDALTRDMKQKTKDKLSKMESEGFMDKQRRDQYQNYIDTASAENLAKLEQQLRAETRRYDQFLEYRREVMPLVDQWYTYFLETLPRVEELDYDDDEGGKSGRLNVRAASRPINLIQGTVYDPRVFHQKIQPKFLATIMLDISLSMNEANRLENAKKLLIFYGELFSRIRREFGYLNFSIYTVAKEVELVKGYDQEYDAPTRYQYHDGSTSTVKSRIAGIEALPYSNLYAAAKEGIADLDKEKAGYPDYASALFYIGDGGDSFGNESKARDFLEHAAKPHMKSATFIGEPHERDAIAKVFGDKSTAVATDLQTLIKTNMNQFDQNIRQYFRGMLAG